MKLLQDAIARYVSYTGRAIVRGTYGAAGSGTFVTDGSSEDMKWKLRTFVQGQVCHIYLVQVMFDIVTTPTVQMFVGPAEGAIRCVGVTDQRIDKNLEHKGNVYPSNAETLADMIGSARLGNWPDGFRRADLQEWSVWVSLSMCTRRPGGSNMSLLK